MILACAYYWTIANALITLGWEPIPDRANVWHYHWHDAAYEQMSTDFYLLTAVDPKRHNCVTRVTFVLPPSVPA